MCLQNGALNNTNIIVTKATVTKMVNNVEKTMKNIWIQVGKMKRTR